MLSGFAVGGGGEEGNAASSIILMWVIYDSATVGEGQLYSGRSICLAQEVIRDPSSSFLPKQLSIILRFSSSNLSALVIPLPLTPPDPFVDEPSIGRSQVESGYWGPFGSNHLKV